MGCFSGPSSQATSQPTLTGAQKRLVDQLGRQAAPAIANVTGATIPGQEFAPGGPSALQQQAFGLPGFEQSQQAFQGSFDPATIQQNFQPTADFARQGFQENFAKSVFGPLGALGAARSSGAGDIFSRESRNLELGLASQLGQQQQAGLNRAFQAPGQALGFAQQIAGLGQQQQAFPEAQRQFDLSNFFAASPEQDPRLGFIGPAFTSAFDTVVENRGAGLGSQLIGAAGAALGGTNFAGSDERIKDNIEPIDDSLKKLSQISGKTYNYTEEFSASPDIKRAGVIAQDVEKVLPEAVAEKDGIKHVDYNAVLALVVNAVNELARKVD
jgi:hypothetical protein